MFKPAAQKAAEKQQEDELVQAWVRSQRLPALTVPLTPGKPSEPEKPKDEQPAKKEEDAKAPVQRAPASTTEAPPATAHVDDALASPGRPLDPATRRSMESRFGYDFSGVRVHDDARAAETATELDAAAFTVGEDVVFGVGRFDPSSPAGRRLLAHELAHVVQQSRGPGGAGPIVQRRSIFESLGILLGIVEGDWEDRELHEYLDGVMRAGRIEGSYDSDNKARAIVRRWKSAAPGFDLRAPEKILLIREMLDGPTLGDDEECILDLLELSDAGDLRAILGPGGVALTNLESDIDGDNRKRLDAFVAGRFDGGRQAILDGRVEVVGPSVPTGAPNYDFDEDTLDTLFDSDRTAEELIEIVARFSPVGRKRALHRLSQVRRPRLQAARDKLIDKARHLTGTPEEQKQKLDAMRPEYEETEKQSLKTERVLLHFFLDAAPATAAELQAGTVPVDPAKRDELREGLHPPLHLTSGGTPAPFRRKLPGEDVNYDEKVFRALTGTPDEKGIIDSQFERLVVGKGKAEHDDPSKVHPLSTFEAIGKVAQEEVVKVFGRYLSKQPPELTAVDRPATPGHAAVKANIHDAFADMERDIKAHPSIKPGVAKNHLLYTFESHPRIAEINAAHDATPDFHGDAQVPHNTEAKLLAKVMDRVLALPGNLTKLVQIERNWPGSESPDRSINVQLFKAETPEKDRLLLWDYFQVLIHEVIHTLVADDYEKYADSLPAASFNTLIEGADSFLTEVVWTNVEPRVGDHDLREKIEGPQLAAEPAITIPHAGELHRYASYTEVLKLVDRVGVESLYAAYFMGLIDRIGGTLPTSAHPAAHHP